MRFAAIVLIVFSATAARADCEHFKWSIAKERAAFAGSPASLTATGGSAEVGTPYALALSKDVTLLVPPGRKPEENSHAAVVTVPKLEAGLYQITLSEEAWIDVVQNGAVIKSSDFSGQKDCLGVRKTVRFNLLTAPVTIELSNSSVSRMNIEISASN